MTDYSELKLLAEQCKELRKHGWLGQMAVSEDKVLELIAEYESANKHWANESSNVQAALAEILRLTAENGALRKDAERFRFIEQDADSGMRRIYGDDWIAVIDAAGFQAVSKEG